MRISILLQCNYINFYFLEFDVKDLITEVYGVVLNIPIPLLGVDNKSVCNNLFEENGTKKKCPVLNGSTYVYKDEIYIIEAYPKVNYTFISLHNNFHI